MVQTVEYNSTLEIAPAEHKKSRITKKGQGNGKQGKNHTGRNLQKPNGKSSIPTGPISLKVKFGPRSLTDVIPLIGKGTDKQCTTGKERKESPKVARNIDDQLEEELNLDDLCVSLSDICQPEKDSSLDPAAKSLDCHHESPCQEGLAIDNNCSDPGTSPDSEVINLVPGTPINAGDPEDSHDLILSKLSASPGDIPSLSMHEKSKKKGRKKDRIPKVASSCVQDLLSPESMSNTEKFGQLMQRAWGESFHSDTSAMITAGNGPGNMSSAEIFSAELPSCSDLGISCASSKFGRGLEGNICYSLDAGSPESELSAKVASSPAGRNVPKGESCNIFGKGRSQVPKSSQRRPMASKKKGNKEKQYSKHEVRHESGLVKSLGVVNCLSRPENDAQSGYEDVGSGSRTLNGAIPDLDILRTEVSEHHLKPRNAWVQCDDCQKWRRIAAALADQIEETNCKWTCKDNLDRSFGDCSIGQEKSNSEINAELEISDASGEEGAFDTRLNSNRSGQKKPLVTHQSSWTLIKKNLFLHRSRKNQTIDEIMVCHCKPASDGRMGCGDGCLNRMLNIECVRRTCPCGEFCSNQQFQKRNYTGLKWFKCGKKGYGLQLLQDVSEGQFLIEYVGEVLDLHAYEARQKEYALKGHKHFYFMTLNGSEVIDACAKGNLGRFINHSCDPNCRTEKWMVNGEVCVGLFALRDIKKGEEVTFDYNYVRVFGAAAKRCICGSPQCRGYIGGDLLNAEVIVQDDSDDDYPAPVVQCEDGNMDDELNNIRSQKSSFSVGELRTQGITPINKNKLDEPFTRKLETSSQTHIAGTMDPENVNMDNSVAVVTLKMREESKSFPNKSTSSALKKVETSAVIEGLESLSSPSDQPVGASLSWEDITSETMSEGKKGSSDADKVTNDSFSSAPEIELTSPSTMLSKSMRKFKSGNGGGRDESSKSSHQSSSTKKGKTKSNAMNFTSPPNMDSKFQFPQHKFKRPSYGSSNDRSEAVEDKLNELLDKDGGISKSKDASRCYLKLLLLTAASGDSGNGEAIQSNRDLSMILDALLKTKSRTVLADIINKNGLQMLHNTMKRYRREFNKIPILRKLLKVLEYLAVREILSHEQINGGPSRPGVESFTGSILRLTEHTDKQVHQIARNFRDRWIHRPLRKRSRIDGDDIRMDLRPSSHYNRRSELQNQWSEGSAQPSQTTDGSRQSGVASTTADASMLGGSSASCFVAAASVARKRKRKSRWDEEAEPNLDPRSETNVADDRRQDIDDDEVPPGFSVPIKASSITCDASSTAACSVQEHSSSRQQHPVAMGNFQQRFISRSPVSYGIPLSMVQQFGSPQKERLDAWAVAPGIPFHPFPPLPPYPRDRRDSVPSAANAGVFSESTQNARQDNYSSPSHSAQNLPSISGAGAPQEEANTKLDSQRVRDSHNLGRKYFRQQKLTNSTFLPWHRGKSRWGCPGNNSNNTMCSIGVASRENELRSSHSWEDVNPKMENLGHTFQQNLPQ